MRSKLGALPHAAIVCSGPQLMSVIAELEAGTYPQPDAAIWREDLPVFTRVRLAKATGATDEQIAGITGARPELTAGQAGAITAEALAHSIPGVWTVTTAASGSMLPSEYRNGKDAHAAASDVSTAPDCDYAAVTYDGCVTIYRDGIGEQAGDIRKAGRR